MGGKPGDLCSIAFANHTLVQEWRFSIEKADSLRYSQEGLKMRIGQGCKTRPRNICGKFRTVSTSRGKAASTDAANIPPLAAGCLMAEARPIQ
jgi:hypothetical protein